MTRLPVTAMPRCSDADLAALALPCESYRQNTAAIRYSQSPDGVFRKAGSRCWSASPRKALGIPHPTGRQQWEAAAQRNLRAELAALAGLIFSRPLKSKTVQPCNGAGVVRCPMANEQGPISVPVTTKLKNPLSGVALSRLVTSFRGQLEIFPVNFVTQNRPFCLHRRGHQALHHGDEREGFEADDHTADEGWSVILRGTARMLSGAEEIREAEQVANLMPWVPTEKLRRWRVTATDQRPAPPVRAGAAARQRAGLGPCADPLTQYGTRARYWRRPAPPHTSRAPSARRPPPSAANLVAPSMGARRMSRAMQQRVQFDDAP